jgi:CheY-like chemotaxis protein
LIVDDLHTNLTILSALLNSFGVEAMCADNGEEAVELVRRAEKQFDLIFMDLEMPGMNGEETLRSIREEIGTPYAKNVPVVLCTAKTLDAAEAERFSKSFHARLTKPVKLAELESVLARFLAKP